MIARLTAFALLLLALASPAQAQLSAVYKLGPDSPMPMEMKVEIAPNGDVRGTMPGLPMEVMTLSGEGYFVVDAGEGPQVMRASDMAAVFAEEMPKMDPKAVEAFKAAPPIVLVKGGKVTINGRTGTGWYFKAGDARPVVVMSDDPVLAPLGKAMAGQFEISMKSFAAMTGGAAAPMGNMPDVLRSGAPISFSGMELVSVSTDPIPASRFVLPATPLDREGVRKQMSRPQAPKP